MPQKTIDQLVADARSRISAMRVAPPSGEASSRAAAKEFELAIDALVMSLPIGRTADFHEVVAKVEERFRPVYDREAVSNAKTDGQMSEASTRESTGWWIVLSRAGVAIRTGDTKPEYEVGDIVVFTLQRLPRKKPDATPDLAIVPPTPLPPVDARAALERETDRLRGILRQCQRGADVADLGNGEILSLYLPHKLPDSVDPAGVRSEDGT